MGAVRNVQGMFGGVHYSSFTTEEVKTAMNRKIQFLQTKITQRGERIKQILEENGIPASSLADIIDAYNRRMQRGGRQQYATSLEVLSGSGGSEATPSVDAVELPGSSRVVPGGLIANIVFEREVMASEREEVKRMTRISRNLRDLPTVDSNTNLLVMQPVVHHLSDDEIDYLGLQAGVKNVPVAAGDESEND